MIETQRTCSIAYGADMSVLLDNGNTIITGIGGFDDRATAKKSLSVACANSLQFTNNFDSRAY